jgi:hypothetical protein
MITKAREWLQKHWYGILVAYGLVCAVLYTTMWTIAEPLDVPREFALSRPVPRWFIHILLTILLGAIITIILDLLVKREARMKSTQVEPVVMVGDYCKVSQAIGERSEFFDFQSLREDHSDLWYMFINTREFESCKAAIELYFNDHIKDLHWRNIIQDVSIWSLLGAAEILVKFRADEATAKKIERELLARLRPPVPVRRKDILEPNYRGYQNSKLESTHVNPKGLKLINVSQEYVPDEEIGNYAKKRLVQKSPTPNPDRNLRVFIKYQFKDPLIDAEIIGRILHALKLHMKYIETYTTAGGTTSKPEYMIIQAYFPCGLFGELRRLSSNLEKHLGNNIIKETYVVYEGGPLQPADAENGRRTSLKVYEQPC